MDINIYIFAQEIISKEIYFVSNTIDRTNQ